MKNKDITYFRIRNILVFVLLMNTVFLFYFTEISRLLLILGTIFISILYLYINIIPIKEKELSKRLKIMVSGYELIIDAVLSIVIESIFYIYYFFIQQNECNMWIIAASSAVAIIIIGFAFFNGFIRTLFTSRQLGITERVLFIFLWWVPIINLAILKVWCKKVREEYVYEKRKLRVNETRKESEVCKTKYPIVLVHGIFFRDWHIINYWGRIPDELMKNGATIYYGKQQSSDVVAKSAEEIRDRVLKIIKENNCEKVNIIAHSKGGLDSRYAVSKLGLDKYVASLTTINTPHRGCKFVDYLLSIIPNSIQMSVAKKYDKLFKKLGDDNPNFIGGVRDLTAAKCIEFNEKVIDKEGVLYQSVMTKMKGVFSASFPLNVGYMLCKHFEGENDGLVSVDSAKWGDYLGLIRPLKKGISHGDIVDLTRKDIKGFDVCEYYVKLVNNLKEKGL